MLSKKTQNTTHDADPDRGRSVLIARRQPAGDGIRKTKGEEHELVVRMIMGLRRMAGVVVIVGTVRPMVIVVVGVLVGPVIVVMRVFVKVLVAMGMGVCVAVSLTVVRVIVLVGVLVFVVVLVGVLVFVVVLMLVSVFAFHDTLLLVLRFTASTSSADRHPGGSRDLSLRAVQRISHPCRDNVALS
jgi:hypothetical protein